MVNILCQRLKEQRELRKMSQKDVAKAINASCSLVSNYENGSRVPSIDNLMALARLFRCSTDYLLGLDKSQPKMIDVSMLNPEQIALLKQFLNSFEK